MRSDTSRVNESFEFKYAFVCEFHKIKIVRGNNFGVIISKNLASQNENEASFS